MRDKQLQHQRKVSRVLSKPTFDSSPTKSKTATPIKCLSWEEMQKKQAQGLCFNYDAKFVLGHRCKEPQFLLLDRGYRDYEIDEDEDRDEPEISLHALTEWSSSKTM
ncbi:conserved hypothetical protein [Ricinus communis]|uniref:Uncharacterized protein n=1 Tax=Ricinus communis TaxID=3988 RepID=B9SJ72_RICCO|nr:conserved hypothetical protein [Ricinus communis]